MWIGGGLTEGELRYEKLSSVEKRVADEMFACDPDRRRDTASFLKRRVRLLFDILHDGWKYREFNDVSMPLALTRQVWNHFFDRKVRL